MNDTFKRPECPCFQHFLPDAPKVIVGDYKSNVIANDMYQQFRASLHDDAICPKAIAFMSVETIAFILRAVAFIEMGYSPDDIPDLAKMKVRFDELVAALPAALMECDEKLIAITESQMYEGRQQ